MRNFILGLVFGVVLGFLSYKPYVESSYAQVTACTEMYMANIDKTDAEILKAVKDEGFKDIRALVKDRCTGWVRGGQKFRD